MKTISEQYQQMVSQVHQEHKWGASSGKWVGTVRSIMRQRGLRTLLDYGCGQGVLLKRMKQYYGLQLTGYDPGIAELKQKPTGKFDIVVSTDVFEHIEEEYIDAVLSEINEYMLDCGFFTICLKLAQTGWLPDGRNAHILIRTRQWWMSKLKEYFDVQEMYGRGWKERELVVFVTKK